MNKDEVEQSFRRGGTTPVLREKVGDYDVFIADGFSKPPHLRLQRFGIEPDQYPGGAYCTIWWCGKDEVLYLGRPIFFDATELTDPSRASRVRVAKEDAERHIKMIGKH